MTYNFLGCDRDQPFLLPPDLRDWLPRAHLAWFILDAVDQLDLAPFYRAHRDDGHGHPAYDAKLLLGGHCRIEPECAGEAQQRGDSPSWKDAKKGSDHSTVPMVCRLGRRSGGSRTG